MQRCQDGRQYIAIEHPQAFRANRAALCPAFGVKEQMNLQFPDSLRPTGTVVEATRDTASAVCLSSSRTRHQEHAATRKRRFESRALARYGGFGNVDGNRRCNPVSPRRDCDHAGTRPAGPGGNREAVRGRHRLNTARVARNVAAGFAFDRAL